MKRVLAVTLLSAGLAHAAPRSELTAAHCTGPTRVQCLINLRLVHQLKNGRPEVRLHAAQTLGERRAKAAPALPSLERRSSGERHRPSALCSGRSVRGRHVGPVSLRTWPG